MRSFHLTGTLLLLTLLPGLTLARGSTVHSIIDSILTDAAEYLTEHAAQFYVESIQRLDRSCPLSYYETLLDGDTTYTLSICVNASGLALTPPIPLVNKVEIGRTKLDMSVQVKKCIHPEVNVKLSAPVFDDVYIKAFWFLSLPANSLKGVIISEAEKRIESELRVLISAFG